MLAFILAFAMILTIGLPTTPVFAAADYGYPEEMIKEYEDKAAEVVRGFGFDENTSDYDKVYELTKWIKTHVAYERYEYLRSNGATNNKYTKHTGLAGNHMWNLVKVGSEYYYIDPTNVKSDNIENGDCFLFGSNSAIGWYSLSEYQPTDIVLACNSSF